MNKNKAIFLCLILNLINKFHGINFNDNIVGQTFLDIKMIF